MVASSASTIETSEQNIEAALQQERFAAPIGTPYLRRRTAEDNNEFTLEAAQNNDDDSQSSVRFIKTE